MPLPLARLAKDGERGQVWPKSEWSKQEYLRLVLKAYRIKKGIHIFNQLNDSDLLTKNERLGISPPPSKMAIYQRRKRKVKRIKNAAASSAKQQP